MKHQRRRGPTLMPAVALAALGALVTIPTLSNVRLYAAPPARYASVTVRHGDSLWAIAERFTPSGSNVAETVDAISATNHLAGATIVPGQTLKIPR